MAETDEPLRARAGATLGGGRYRLIRRLGAGGMATVWLASDERLQRDVAVKLIADTLAGDESWLRRFSREARAAAALSHRGVVPVFDYGVQDGRPYLVMEYIPGGNLAQRLDPQGSGAGPERAPVALNPMSFARELLEALEGVHAAGILHRDVKPANLLIDSTGHVRLTDFGIAQTQDATGLTRTGMIVGTLRYIAPEVAAGAPASVASDLYSAGMVIRQVAGDPPPPALHPLIEALTAGEPGDRPRTAADALALLGEAETAQTSILSHRPPPSDATAVQARTEPTRVRPARSAPVAAGRPVGARRPPGARPPAGAGRAAGAGGLALLDGLARRPRALLAALLGLVVLIVVILLIAGSGGGGTSRAGSPSPAPARASIPRQIEALQQIVRSAQRH